MKYLGEKIVVLLAFAITWKLLGSAVRLAGGTNTMGVDAAICVVAAATGWLIKVATWRGVIQKFLISTEVEYRKIEWPSAAEVLSSVRYLIAAVVGVSGLTLLVDLCWQKLFAVLGFLSI